MISASIDRPQSSRETDTYRGDIPARLPVRLVKELSAISGWKSTIAIVSEWGAICAAMVLYQAFLHPLFLPVVVMWIGARQHGLAVLMHEGAHYHLFKNRRTNAIVSELFLAWPIFVTTDAYRDSHFAHHRHVNTEKDPDLQRKQNAEWEFPKTWTALALLLARDVSGLNTHQQLLEATDLSDAKGAASSRTGSYTAARYAYYATILSAVTYFQLWPAFLLLWIVPLLTWLKMVLRVRSIAEHFAIENDHVYSRTRTTLPSIAERLFVSPKNINFHLEHHLYPSVPFYRLRELHEVLMDDAEFRSKAHVTSTYWGVLKECVGHGRDRSPRVPVESV